MFATLKKDDKHIDLGFEGHIHYGFGTTDYGVLIAFVNGDKEDEEIDIQMTMEEFKVLMGHIAEHVADIKEESE